MTFSVGCVLFRVFAAEQEDADLSPDNEAWLALKGLYTSALLQIAPSCSLLRWPPEAVFGVGDREALAGRLGQGFHLDPERRTFLARADIRAAPGEGAGLRRGIGIRRRPRAFNLQSVVELDDHRRLFWGVP